MKVVINRCYGGFGLSARATDAIYKRKGKKLSFFHEDRSKPRKGVGKIIPLKNAAAADALPGYDIWYATTGKRLSFKNAISRYSFNGDTDRSDPDLVAVVEQMGEAASSPLAELAVVEIPDGVEYDIEDYDGVESIHEVHRSWR